MKITKENVSIYEELYDAQEESTFSLMEDASLDTTMRTVVLLVPSVIIGAVGMVLLGVIGTSLMLSTGQSVLLFLASFFGYSATCVALVHGINQSIKIKKRREFSVKQQKDTSQNTLVAYYSGYSKGKKKEDKALQKLIKEQARKNELEKLKKIRAEFILSKNASVEELKDKQYIHKKRKNKK